MEKLIIDQGVILKDQRGCVLYVPESMQLFCLDLPTETSMEGIRKYLPPSFNTTSNPLPRNASKPKDLHLGYREAVLPIMVEKDILEQQKIKPKIRRLTINISNACNLWCSYCYADHGHYHSPKSFMSPELAEKIISSVLENYDSIDTIQFFGGEPLMNLQAIDAVGEFLVKKVKAKELGKLPSFVATTNGTLSSKKVLETLKRWNMELTLSWDGFKEVHDANRPTLGGGSSYNQILQTIEKLHHWDIPYEIECTYNSLHLEKGISVVDLMDFFYEQTGHDSFHIAPAFLPDTQSKTIEEYTVQQVFRGEALETQKDSYVSASSFIPYYMEAARYTVNNIFQNKGPLLSFAKAIVGQIINKQPSLNYCPAFFTQLSIAIDGTAYPCFMFIGDPQFQLGNILTDSFPTEKSKQVFQKYFSEFGYAPVGTEAWYADLFSGCIAGEYITSGAFRERTGAALFEAMIQECLMGVALNFDKNLPQVEQVEIC